MLKIIAGVDGGPGGADAAALASALAGLDTDVLLVGVYRDPLLPLPITFGHNGELRAGTEHVLREVRDEHAPRARTMAVCDSFPARALRHVAEREHADLLVLGSTHRADSGAAGVGRRARQVLHDAGSPVAIAARGVSAQPGRPRRIVVGLDGSPESQAALAAAADARRRRRVAHLGRRRCRGPVADDDDAAQRTDRARRVGPRRRCPPGRRRAARRSGVR
jgi:nucleotide-binding universal stress UspA family protein